MRSEYVFAAAKKIGNRFLLCRVTSASARSLQVNSKQPSETINKALRLIAVKPAGELQGESDISLTAAAIVSGNGPTDTSFLDIAEDETSQGATTALHSHSTGFSSEPHS